MVWRCRPLLHKYVPLMSSEHNCSTGTQPMRCTAQGCLLRVITTVVGRGSHHASSLETERVYYLGEALES